MNGVMMMVVVVVVNTIMIWDPNVPSSGTSQSIDKV